MKLKAGQALYSRTDSTAVLVVRCGDLDVSITCGGQAMATTKDEGEKLPPTGPPGQGAALGKRYVDVDHVVELLCTKPGEGELAIDETPLTLLAAKQLPASD
jgi:hypothetical protein